ncbi:Uncharacterised protein [Klebsiella variicola]|uniref:Uncharacterized protein n=1 Tax=Klebsiella variicola TaxID=244366 RepID=A0A7H4MPZ7_KLEVA|nr:Uncharacterised protein [Klebsiella variicola]
MRHRLLSLAVEPGLARRLLRLANRFIRTHRLLHLALVRRLVLVLRRLTRGFMLPMRAVRGVSDRMNADFTYAFNIIIKVFVFRLIVRATSYVSVGDRETSKNVLYGWSKNHVPVKRLWRSRQQ